MRGLDRGNVPKEICDLVNQLVADFTKLICFHVEGAAVSRVVHIVALTAPEGSCEQYQNCK
jgi:hypothetical protein